MAVDGTEKQDGVQTVTAAEVFATTTATLVEIDSGRGGEASADDTLTYEDRDYRARANGSSLAHVSPHSFLCKDHASEAR